MLTLRLAQPADETTVIGVYKRSVAAMCEMGIYQWDEIYPSEAQIQADINNSEMYLVCDDGCIVGAVVLNDREDESYTLAAWKCAAPFAVVHRLCIDPASQSCGVGRQAMRLAQTMLKEKGFASVRLDAYSQNPHALSLYKTLGYRQAGEATYRKGLFYLFEKSLS